MLLGFFNYTQRRRDVLHDVPHYGSKEEVLRLLEELKDQSAERWQHELHELHELHDSTTLCTW